MKIKNKRLIAVLIFLAGSALIFYFWPKNPGTQPEQISNKADEEDVKKESQSPVAKIVSPPGGSFHNKSFPVKVWDVDSGGSGIDASQCSYSIYNCSAAGCELFISNKQRACNADFSVKAGETGDCFSQGVNSCRVVVKSKDSAGNNNIIAEAEDSIRDFSIDWTAPEVEITALPSDVAKAASVRVFDNVQISNCDLTVDGQSQYGLGKQFVFSECPQGAGGKCYEASLELVLVSGEDHELRASCWDGASNLGYSKTVEIKAIVSRQPEISSCRVSPVQWNVQQEFQFEAEAFDPDGEELSYLWNFGDGLTSFKKNPVHRYGRKGIFEPQVTVSDGAKEAKCSTAWVSIAEE